MKEGIKLSPAMERAYYRIRDGHYNSVDLTSAKALERRGIVRIRYDVTPDGRKVLSLGRPFVLLVDSII